MLENRNGAKQMTNENNKKIDRRKKYTQMVLKQSFIELLKQKPIAKITVKEVCERADINRSTFYAHYEDLYHLLEQIEKEMIQEMVHYLSLLSEQSTEKSMHILEKIMEYIAANKDVCAALLSENSHSSFEQKVREVAHRFLSDTWLNVPNEQDTIIDYISAFVISGSIQIIKVWLKNDMDKSPKEIAYLINKLVNDGIQS